MVHQVHGMDERKKKPNGLLAPKLKKFHLPLDICNTTKGCVKNEDHQSSTIVVKPSFTRINMTQPT